MEVEVGLAAAQAGLQPGDLIQSVDGALCYEHKRVIRQIDRSSGSVALVVASSKVTEEAALEPFKPKPRELEIEIKYE